MAWNDTLDNDARAAAAAKGWDRLSDTEAAQTMFKSYVNLEKSRPDPTRTVVLPSTPDDPAWEAVYQRLGAPKDVSGYAFEGVTFKDGTVPDAPLFDFIKATAAKLHLPVDAAKQLAAELVAYTDGASELNATSLQEKITAGETALKTDWGDNYDNNTTVAARAFGAMGLEKEVIDTLVETLGVEKVMALGYDLGKKMSEPELLKGGGNPSPGGTTGEVVRNRDEAMKERNRLMADDAFGAKIKAGDVEAMKQLDTLVQQIVGTQGDWSAAPRGFGRTRDDTTGQMIDNV